MYRYLVHLLEDPLSLLTNPIVLVMAAFTIWMFVHAVRNGEYVWAAFIFLFPLFNAVLYYVLVYRASQPAGAPTFELPGSHQRKRIKELQSQIHHLDKAHHHAQLADIYFAQGKLAYAEKEYLLALERDPDDIDTIAHFGQCLLRLNRPADARQALEKVIRANADHEYGQTLMVYAETLAMLGDKEGALKAWRKVLESHSYAQARVELARLLIANGDKEAARHELHEVIADSPHGPAFQRRRERQWISEARALEKTLK